VRAKLDATGAHAVQIWSHLSRQSRNSIILEKYAQVAIAHIIGKNKNNIRLSCLGMNGYSYRKKYDPFYKTIYTHLFISNFVIRSYFTAFYHHLTGKSSRDPRQTSNENHRFPVWTGNEMGSSFSDAPHIAFIENNVKKHIFTFGSFRHRNPI